jgi:PAS domain S-box-containing protein
MKASESLQNDESTATENALRRAVDTTPAFIHTARPDGYLDYFNRGWLDFFGKSLEEVCGWRWTESVHPEDVDGIVQKWRAALASGEPFEAEARVRRADGTYRALLHRKAPLHDEHGNIVKWFGSSIDIEDRKRAEEKVREQETELRQILDLAPQHVFVFEPDTNPVYANQVALEYYGVGLEQLLAESRINLVHPDDRERFLAEREKAMFEGTPHEFEIRLLRHDGKFRWFLVRRNPLKDEQGRITRWFGTATDIEDRKQTEEKLRSENAALREELGKRGGSSNRFSSNQRHPQNSNLHFASVSRRRVERSQGNFTNPGTISSNVC